MKRNSNHRTSYRHTLLALALAAALPAAAFAHDAFVVADVGLQAGPDQDYPSITELQAGTEVALQGCIDAFTWCDVVAGGDRGWVPGSYLEEDYDSGRVLVIDYGPRIGIPIVSFSVDTYWDQHYRSRPFYAQRATFVSRHIEPRAMPRPAQVAQGSATRSGTQSTQSTTQAGAQATTQQSTNAGRTATTQQTTREGKTATAQQSSRAGQSATTQQSAQAGHGATTQQSTRTGQTATTEPSRTRSEHDATQQSKQSASSATSMHDRNGQAPASEHATAQTRDTERNVPNVHADQREGTHGVNHPMPPTVQSGQGEHQVASSKRESQPQQQQPKNKKDSDKRDEKKDNGKDREQEPR